MTRVSSVGTQKRIYLLGEPLLEGEKPEMLSLYEADGTPIYVGPDPTKMSWRGVWSTDNSYIKNEVVIAGESLYIFLGDAVAPGDVGPFYGGPDSDWELIAAADSMRWIGDWETGHSYRMNDVVRHELSLYIAPILIPAGTEPGVIIPDPDVGTPNRGVQFKQSDRISSSVPRTIVIGDPPGQRRDNDISVGYGGVVLVDKSGATSGLTVTITPLTVSSSSENMQVAMYNASMGLSSVTTWSNAEVLANTPKAITIPNDSNDYYMHVFFGGGVDGSFSAEVNDVTNLNAPPELDVQWEKLVDAFDTAVAVPSGGTTYQILRKESDADNDTGWATLPHELPSGGADTYILAKASASDYDVEWVTSPTDPAVIDRRTTAKTTASLVAAADTGNVATRLAGGGESGTWVIGPGTLLTKIVATKACRVRLYTSTVKRTADISRDRFTDPTGDHGCLAEFLLISTLSMDNIPADYLASGNADSDIFYRIENYDITAGAVTVTLTVKDVEL